MRSPVIVRLGGGGGRRGASGVEGVGSGGRTDFGAAVHLQDVHAFDDCGAGVVNAV